MPTPESLARQTIDQKLTAAGWAVQSFTAVSFIYRLVKFAGAIQWPPYNLTLEDLWRAYERLDKSRVRGGETVEAADRGNLASVGGRRN